jgi:hypothetical protein
MEQAAKEQPQLTKEELTLAHRIADELGEREKGPQALIRRVIRELGADLSLQFFLQAKKIEEQGGMLLPDGKTRRTPGGVFFRIIKEEAPKHGHPNIYKLFWQRPTRIGPPTPPTPPKKLTWLERLQIIARLRGGPMSTVVLKVIGRVDASARETGACTILKLTANFTPSVPKGVPIPEHKEATYIVYLGNKLWKRIEQAADDPEDELIIEGFPQLDLETSSIALFAKKATSKKMEAERFKKPEQAKQEG